MGIAGVERFTAEQYIAEQTIIRARGSKRLLSALQRGPSPVMINGTRREGHSHKYSLQLALAERLLKIASNSLGTNTGAEATEDHDAPPMLLECLRNLKGLTDIVPFIQAQCAIVVVKSP